MPVPAQLRRVPVVAPYLAGIAWPRTPLSFFGNPQSWPNPIALGRYEWLVPAVEIKDAGAEFVDKYVAWNKFVDIETNKTVTKGCKTSYVGGAAHLLLKVPRCVYVRANYVKQPKVCGPIMMAPPPPMPMPMKVKK